MLDDANRGENSSRLKRRTGHLQTIGSRVESLLSHFIQLGDGLFECDLAVEQRFTLLSFLVRHVGAIRLELFDLLKCLQCQVDSSQLFIQREDVISNSHIIGSQYRRLLECRDDLVITEVGRPRCAGLRHDARLDPVENQMSHSQHAIAFG